MEKFLTKSFFCTFFLLFHLVCATDTYTLSSDESLVIDETDFGYHLRASSSLSLAEIPAYAENSSILDTNESSILLSVNKGSFIRTKRLDAKHVEITVHDESEKSDYFTVLLDAGHGGHDPGALSQSGMFEKDVTLDFVKLISESLLKHRGVNLMYTRINDTTLSKYDRLKIILDAQPDLVISVHADASTSNLPSGFGVFVLDQNKSASMRSIKLLEPFDGVPNYTDSTGYANAIIKQLKNKVKLHADVAKTAPLVVLRAPGIPSMLLELGFLSNADEAKLLANKSYLKTLSIEVAHAIMQKHWAA